MAMALLIAGIFAFVAGVLTVLWGISLKEFSLGSTLIISGTVGVCSGLLLVGLYAVARELKGIARRLAASAALSPDVRVRPVLPLGLATAGMPVSDAGRAEAAKVESPTASSPGAAPPWQDEAAARERSRTDTPPTPEAPTPPAAPEAPRRRNLLFASTSRKERERAQAKTGEGVPPEAAPPAAAPEPAAQASFDDAWPKPERMRPPEPPLPRRPSPQPAPSRSLPTFAEPALPPAPEPRPSPPEQKPEVTVLKSGVVDGMAYSLYSDGSIEAQMPEGMMRFASIDELRTHLDQRS